MQINREDASPGSPMRRMMAWGACVLVGSTALAGSQQPQLRVTPSSGLIDAPFHVVVRGLVPGTRVKVSASRPDDQGRNWTAVGDYLTDADGRIDVDVAPSLGGSYEGVSPHGLWCSVLPVAPERLSAYVAELPKHPELGTAPHLDVSALYAVELTASVNGEAVAHATATRTYAAGIKPEEVTAPGVRGRFFPPAAGAAPGVPVLVLAGSGGGLPDSQAALLASHGHPALAQGIFAYKDLPPTLRSIPLESFQSGARWLEQRTGARRVAVMGTSRGSEAAGLAASYFPQDFAAAVLYVPSHLSNGAIDASVHNAGAAWTYEGKPLPADQGETDSNNADESVHASIPPGFIATPYYLKTWSDPHIAATLGIPFERMQGPVLAIGAGADEMWPSFIGAEQIRRRLAAHGKASQAEVHIYPGAGHTVSRVGVGGPLSPFVYHPVAKDFEATGGLPVANCEGSYDAWRSVIEFLAKVDAR
jgi:pimeloyl-ACP methyl ester carboxylesterase